mmetsp:Transcript_65891/g.167162  ORF Transcript_65891/g.167162 Transcript_65891/m.167162 type:complete len:226 (-) Transcript_65891:1308-1985(-)
MGSALALRGEVGLNPTCCNVVVLGVVSLGVVCRGVICPAAEVAQEGAAEAAEVACCRTSCKAATCVSSCSARLPLSCGSGLAMDPSDGSSLQMPVTDEDEAPPLLHVRQTSSIACCTAPALALRNSRTNSTAHGGATAPAPQREVRSPSGSPSVSAAFCVEASADGSTSNLCHCKVSPDFSHVTVSRHTPLRAQPFSMMLPSFSVTLHGSFLPVKKQVPASTRIV